MHVTRLDQFDTLCRITSAWDCMAHGNPFRRTGWLHSWFAHYSSLGELFVLQVADDQGAIVGIAPWLIEQSLRSGRVVRPLGSGDVCSEYLGILATKEHEQHVVEALVRWLRLAADGEHGIENRWDLLDLVSVDVDDPVMKHFADEMADNGMSVHRRDAMSCWQIPLPDTWDEYLANFSKSRRKWLRGLDRKWLKSGKTQLRVATTPDEVSYAMAVLVRLHQERQISVGNAGCFADPAFEAFLSEAAERLLPQQMVRLCWMEVEGEPIAAEYLLTNGATVYAYQSGISCRAQNISPGQIILIAMIKNCIDQGQRTFDFLRGDEAYKFSWQVRERRCVDYRIVPQHHAAQFRHQMWLAGDTMKQWIRTGLQVTGVH